MQPNPFLETIDASSYLEDIEEEIAARKARVRLRAIRTSKL